MRSLSKIFIRQREAGPAWPGLLLLACFACATPLLDQAWQGELDPQMANEVIVAYCQNCHSHKEFTAVQCLDNKPSLYDRLPYKTATECRICHFLQKEFWRPSHAVRRHTRRPKDVKQDKYIEFEKEILKNVSKKHKNGVAAASSSDVKEETSSILSQNP
ncbi:MAG: hypothetical protein ACE5JO_08900 [Candidatus Binatia bacterium]